MSHRNQKGGKWENNTNLVAKRNGPTLPSPPAIRPTSHFILQDPESSADSNARINSQPPPWAPPSQSSPYRILSHRRFEYRPCADGRTTIRRRHALAPRFAPLGNIGIEPLPILETDQGYHALELYSAEYSVCLVYEWQAAATRS